MRDHWAGPTSLHQAAGLSQVCMTTWFKTMLLCKVVFKMEHGSGEVLGGGVRADSLAVNPPPPILLGHIFGGMPLLTVQSRYKYRDPSYLLIEAPQSPLPLNLPVSHRSYADAPSKEKQQLEMNNISSQEDSMRWRIFYILTFALAQLMTGLHILAMVLTEREKLPAASRCLKDSRAFLYLLLFGRIAAVVPSVVLLLLAPYFKSDLELYVIHFGLYSTLSGEVCSLTRKRSDALTDSLSGLPGPVCGPI